MAAFYGASAYARPAPPLPVRTVIVTAFEVGKDTGDSPGEYQAWATVMPRTLPFPAGERPLRYDPARRALLVMTGIGTNRAATSITALGLDPRFDLSHAYWLIAAIAGVDPNHGSVGSAAWIGDVVDTDYGYAIDPREKPADWDGAMLARDRKRPYEGPPGDSSYNLFPLNKGLRNWAFALTRDTPLPDSPALKQIRSGYTAYAASQCPPHMMIGDEGTGQTFWHGGLLNTHVEKWVTYWTGRSGSFVMTGMEDSGVAHALDALGRIGKVDRKRLMILRTGSNYSVQPEGQDAAHSLLAESGGLSALHSALDAAFRVGSRVVDEINRNWARYRDVVPSAPAPAPSGQPCGN